MQFQDVWFAIFATSFTVALSHKQVTPHVLIHLVFCRWPVARAGSACQWMKLQMEPITGAKQPAEPLQPSNMLRGSSSLRDSAWICTAKRCFAAIRFVESQGVDIWWYDNQLHSNQWWSQSQTDHPFSKCESCVFFIQQRSWSRDSWSISNDLFSTVLASMRLHPILCKEHADRWFWLILCLNSLKFCQRSVFRFHPCFHHDHCEALQQIRILLQEGGKTPFTIDC